MMISKIRKINLLKNDKIFFVVLSVVILISVTSVGVYLLSAHPKEDAGLPGPPNGFNPYFVGVCSNDQNIVCDLYTSQTSCGAGNECMLGYCQSTGELCNPYVCQKGVDVNRTVCSNDPTVDCDPINPSLGYCAGTGARCSADSQCGVGGSCVICGTCQPATCNDLSAANCYAVRCGGLRDTTSCILNTGPCLSITAVSGEPANWYPAGCGTCKNILSDLDNCPGGGFAKPCYDPVFPTVQVSCSNPDQGDGNLNLYGNVCDYCGNGTCDFTSEDSTLCPQDCDFVAGASGVGAGDDPCGDGYCAVDEYGVCAADCTFFGNCPADACPLGFECYDARGACYRCLDLDFDGYVVAQGYGLPCLGLDGVPDCNDSDPNIHPDAGESGNTCLDGIDNDCDGVMDCFDPDPDCVGDPICPGGGGY